MQVTSIDTGSELQILESKFKTLCRRHRKFISGSILFLSVVIVLLSMHLFYQLVIIPPENEQNNDRVFRNEYYNSQIFVIGEATQKDVDQLVLSLGRITRNADGVWEEFVNTGGMVYLSEIPLRDLPHNQHLQYYSISGVMGQFVSTPSVQIHLFNHPSTDTLSYELAREFGRFVDWYYGEISNSGAFRAIHEEEKYQFIVYHENADDYFADAFMWYVENFTVLEAFSPLTYAFFVDLFGD